MSRILLIDDCRTIYLKLRQVFEDTPYALERLKLLVDLPKILRLTPPDLVLLDLQMPSLDGERVGEFIRSFEPSPTRIVIYSGGDLAEMERVADRVGAAALISKDAADGEVLSVIRHVLGRPPVHR